MLRTKTMIAGALGRCSPSSLSLLRFCTNISSPASFVTFRSFASSTAPGVESHPNVSHSQEDGQQPDSCQKEYPQLRRIPSLPYIGSQLQLYSGIPSLMSQMHDMPNYWRKLHAEYGPFYTIGIPGFGKGAHGTVHVVRDPDEMWKVIRSEGKYPSGAVEQEWQTIEWMKHANYSIDGLFKRGEEWKRLRSFLQTDLLSPQSAREYLPFVLQGATKASRRYRDDPTMAQDLNRFTSFCSSDMFTGVLFGNPGPEDKEIADVFTNKAVEAFADLIALFVNPIEPAIHMTLGWHTPALKKFFKVFDDLDELAKQRIEDVMARDDASEAVKGSYVYKAMKRQKESNITLKEVMEISIILMIAGVETTSSKTSWNVLQLAVNPEAQKELREQVEAAVAKHGGELVPEVLARDEIPLLQAFIRETHRCTPPLFADIIKPIAKPTQVYGVTLPEGSMLMFDGMTNMMDPVLVDNPLTFNPRRWLQDEVQKRKGTDQSIIDHPFYSGPFSQGARRCPGSRVAYLEIQTMLARLLLDYNIVGPEEPVHWKDIQGVFRGMFVPDYNKHPVKLIPRS